MKWKMEKTTLGFHIYIKYGKFWNIPPGHFIKHKPFISEECGGPIFHDFLNFFQAPRTPEHIKKKVIEMLYVWSTKELKEETKITEAYDMLKKQGIITEDPKYVGDAVFASALPPRKSAPLNSEQTQKLRTLLQVILNHSLIREVLIQSCSARAKNFTNYVFCHPQFSGVIQNIENRCAILTPVSLCRLLSK